MSAGSWRIGAVARMLGVPTATLRTWERRYGLVEPGRAEGQDRLYSERDIERLRRIAALRARGERVADLAALSMEALAERQRAYGDDAPAPAGSDRARAAFTPIRVILAARDPVSVDGPVPSGAGTLEVVARAERLSELPSGGQAHVAVVDAAGLDPDPLGAIRALRAAWGLTAVLVVHRFAPRGLRQTLLAAGARLVRAPVDDLELRQMLFDVVSAGVRVGLAAARPERFESAALAALVHRSVALGCECPNHVARMVIALSDFERYSRECASRSAEDAALHGLLAVGTGEARTIMEDLLVRVCEHEGIALPPARPVEMVD